MALALPFGAAPLQLGPLPYELAVAILLRLSPLERCQAERTCKGWLQFLRSPALWTELDVDAAHVELEVAGLNKRGGLEGLLRRAGAALRRLHVQAPHAFWDEWNGDYVFEVIQQLVRECSALECLRLPQHESEYENESDGVLQDTAALVQVVAQLPRLREFDVGSVHAERDGLEATLEILQTPLAHGCMKLWLWSSFFEENDEGEDGAAELDQLAAALRVCAWRCVAIQVLRGDADIVSFATLLRGFLEGLQTAQAVRTLLIKQILPVEQACWVARATPAHIRIQEIRIACTAAEVTQLRDAFRPGVVCGGMLTLSGEWSSAALLTALAALSACAQGAADAGETAQLGVYMLPAWFGPRQDTWSAAACAPLLEWLRGNGSVTSLRLCVTNDALQLLVPELPVSLQELDTFPRCEAAQIAVLFQRMHQRELPALARLNLGLINLPYALWLRRELDVLPDDCLAGLEVHYDVSTDKTSNMFHCHAVMLACKAACRFHEQYVTLWSGAKDPVMALHELLSAAPPGQVLFSAEAMQPLLVAALHNAAAALSRRVQPFLHDAPLVIKLRLLALTLRQANACEPHIGDGMPHTAPLANASGLRSLAALLPHDEYWAGASLLHAVLCSTEAAQLSTALMCEVALSCAAALRHSTDDCTYKILSLLVACQRAGAAMQPDTRAVLWMQQPNNTASIAVWLAALLRGAALDGELPGGGGHASRRPRDCLGVAALAPNFRSWSLPVVELHVSAVCAWVPDALTADDGGTLFVRDALLALLRSRSRRFLRALSLDSLRERDDPASRCADAYARCIELLLRADAASGGRLELAAPLLAARPELDALRDAFPRALRPPPPPTLQLAAHAHALGLVADSGHCWPRMLRYHTTCCDVCAGCCDPAWRCPAGCSYDCCAQCAAKLATRAATKLPSTRVNPIAAAWDRAAR